MVLDGTRPQRRTKSSVSFLNVRYEHHDKGYHGEISEIRTWSRAECLLHEPAMLVWHFDWPFSRLFRLLLYLLRRSYHHQLELGWRRSSQQQS